MKRTQPFFMHLVLPRVAIVQSKGRYDETFAGEDVFYDAVTHRNSEKITKILLLSMHVILSLFLVFIIFVHENFYWNYCRIYLFYNKKTSTRNYGALYM